MDFDIRLMEDEKYILNSIAYALRNGIAAGYCYCTEDYPWSSGGLYFRMPERIMEMTSGWKQISDIQYFRALLSYTYSVRPVPEHHKL